MTQHHRLPSVNLSLILQPSFNIYPIPSNYIGTLISNLQNLSAVLLFDLNLWRLKIPEIVEPNVSDLV